MPRTNHPKPYLAFDLGAESGRAMLGHLRSGILTVEEIHRFSNDPVKHDNSIRWDVTGLWLEMQKSLAKIGSMELAGIGVDGWGVDYALLDERGELIENPYHYRDRRTEGIMDAVFSKVPMEEIYQSTGIQFMPINTLYQLCAARRDTPKVLEAARTLIMIPDLFHYWMTGKAVCEFTNATTTQMMNPQTRNWSTGLMQRLDLPASLPAAIVEPGSIVGKLLPEIAGSSTLAGTPVIAPATHDTGSAVAAISSGEGTAFLSSGTWSLLGMELKSPVITSEALRLNFTNEGGVCGTTRLLKNVMGLWMLQCCRQSWTTQGHSYDYHKLTELGAEAKTFQHFVDPDDESFLRPINMPSAIDEFCKKTHQPVPPDSGAYVRAILESLAFKYRIVLKSLEQLSGRKIKQIRIIGGGSKNRLLNQLTADATGRIVLSGPAEATALGNLAIQILATGEASSLQEVRALIDRSFPTEIFHPVDTDMWDRHAERFEQYCESIYARN
jgi:rhamnulokinase